MDSELLVDCPTDSVSPNHRQRDAFALAREINIEGLVVCPGQSDWFRMEMPTPYDMQLEVCVPAGVELPDLEYFRAEYPYPEYYLGGGRYTTSLECETPDIGNTTGTYYFHIISAGEPTTYEIYLLYKDRNDGFCFLDEAEPNDNADSAFPIQPDRAYDLKSCVDDDDWFKIALEKGATLRVMFETGWSNGYETNLVLLDDPSSEEPLLFIPDYPHPDEQRFKVHEAGLYYLRVRSITNNRSYSLRIEVDF